MKVKESIFFTCFRKFVYEGDICCECPHYTHCIQMEEMERTTGGGYY